VTSDPVMESEVTVKRPADDKARTNVAANVPAVAELSSPSLMVIRPASIDLEPDGNTTDAPEALSLVIAIADIPQASSRPPVAEVGV